jgi:hypothetical protein
MKMLRSPISDKGLGSVFGEVNFNTLKLLTFSKLAQFNHEFKIHSKAFPDFSSLF